MSIGKQIENILVKLGKDNKPTLVAICVASAKGIFRPIFTMADKTQDKDTKKYTATRECLTELIAIPIYWGSGKVAEVLSKKIAKPKDIDAETFKKIVAGDKFEDAEMASKAKLIRKNLFKMRTNLSMLGVFLAAGLIIPAVCSLTIKPIMKVIQNKKSLNQPSKEPIVNTVQNNNMNFKQNYKNTYYSKMPMYSIKVGGI